MPPKDLIVFLKYFEVWVDTNRVKLMEGCLIVNPLKAFTLSELLIALALLGLIATFYHSQDSPS